MASFRNILVAVDFSETSDDALSAAAELSRTYHAQVHLLHVVPTVIPSAYALEPVGFDLGAYVRQSVDAARAELPVLAARHRLDPALLTVAASSGPAAAQIVEYAKEHAIDVIVLGAHGHGFVDRLLIGSVADRVSRHAPCAILLVPHTAHRPTRVQVEAASGVVS